MSALAEAPSIASQYDAASALYTSETPSDSLDGFLALSAHFRSNSLASKNECIDDIDSEELRYLLVEYYTGKAFSGRSGMGESDMMAFRKASITSAMSHHHHFLTLIHALNADENPILPEDTYKQIVALTDSLAAEPTDVASYNYALGKLTERNAKILRFNTIRACESSTQKLQALQARRIRLGLTEDDDLDGVSSPELARDLWLAQVTGAVWDSVDDVVMCGKEVHMLNQMATGRPAMRREEAAPPVGPQVTKINKDPKTGELVMTHGNKLGLTREDMAAGVFRPGWNLPTMTLEELGEIEYKEAMEREARQAESEANNVNKPQRYEYLVKHGLEDNKDLVDASAVLDQKWDDWKDANPKGSGNKNADVGDRNF
jgi:hypothetical protein